MYTTNKSRPRGRPRRFDPDEAIAKALPLFHARGYDAVSVADVTEALGINPPSFYAAFGNKAELYSRVLDRWANTSAIPFAEILTPDRPMAEALAALLEAAARHYVGESSSGGCMVLEGTRCTDQNARAAALAFNLRAEAAFRDYIAARYPAQADQLTDFVSTTMSGLSAKARNGHSLEQLLSTARIAGLGLKQMLRG
jgi:TetR/AcrR family transcriptional repressor for divergent bdcA